MVDITFEIRGKTIEPGGMKDALDVMFLEHLRNEIRKCLGSVQGEIHGRKPIVKVKGQSLDSLTYEVSGCCPDFIKEAQGKIK